MVKEALLKRVIVEQQDFPDSAEELWDREYQSDILSSFENDHLLQGPLMKRF